MHLTLYCALALAGRISDSTFRPEHLEIKARTIQPLRQVTWNCLSSSFLSTFQREQNQQIEQAKPQSNLQSYVDKNAGRDDNHRAGAQGSLSSQV